MAHSITRRTETAASIDNGYNVEVRSKTAGVVFAKMFNPREHNARVIAASRPKEDGVFVYKRGGRKHHALSVSECPYPLACDREALDLDILDGNHLFLLKGTHTLIDFKDTKRPEKVLDLGCGNGVWIINMAKEWPDCRFTGFDIVPLHPNLRDVDKELEGRVDWVYGNFLTAPLPFPDESFDFVHIKEIAQGVPEDKWDQIFHEAARILRPGGALEVVEEDIMFPQVEPVQSSSQKDKTRTFRSASNATFGTRSSSGEPRSTHVSPIKETANSAAQSDVVESRVTSTKRRAGAKQASPLEAPSHRSESRTSGPSSHSMSSSQDHSSSSSSGKSTSWSGSTGSVRSSTHNLVRTPLSQPWSSNDAPPSMTPLPDSRVHTAAIRVASASDEHAQLERLFEKVFERRFINMKPTSLIPNLLNIHFKRSTASPYLLRYMPPPRRRHRQRTPKGEKLVEEGVPINPNVNGPSNMSTRDGGVASPSTASGPASLKAKSSSADLLAARAKEFYGTQEIAAAREAGSQRVGESPGGPSMIDGLRGDSEERDGGPGNERPGPGVDPNASRVKDLLATQMGVALHLHRSLRGILACKEAMWDEFLLSRGRKPADVDNPRKAKAIRQERLDFDAMMERYRVAAQGRISLDDALQRGLKWTPPAKDSDKLAKIYREYLGGPPSLDQDDSDDSGDNASRNSSPDDEAAGVEGTSLEDDDERITGKPFRRIRAFCAFKAEATT